MLNKASKVVQRASNSGARQYASNLLSEINSILKGIDDIPELWVIEEDDGSILFEWVFPSGRIGFNIESEATESGWYIVTTNGICGYGFLPKIGIRDLLFTLLQHFDSLL